MSETGLKLVVTHLMIAGNALGAGATTAHKGHGYPLAYLPTFDVTADGLNHPGELMPWHMRQVDIGVVAHPAMPITAA